MRTGLHTLIAALLLVLGSGALHAQAVKVEGAWVRGTVPQQQATGAFMRLTPEKGVRLVAASSPLAGVVQIHEMAMDKDVMKMREIPGLDLPAGRTTELKPGGYHVMLMSLKGQIKGGDAVPITLVFEDGAKRRFTQEIVAPAAALGAMPAKPMAGHMH
jgi:hypothetical protein